MIEILTAYSAVITLALYRTYKKKKIYYSNYKNCIRALSEYDKGLADYLESKER